MSIDEELAALEVNESKMTQAPWEPCRGHESVREHGCSCGLIWSVSADVTIGITHKPQDDEKIETEVNDNTRGICAARNVLPKLIAEVRLLRKVLRSLAPGSQLLRPGRILGD